MMIAWYIVAGAAAGLFGGLLGIGGGIIVVPLLMMLFASQHIADALAVPLAIGTSLASIAFTSLSCTRSHHKRGSVDWSLVRAMAPALVTGAALGATASSLVPAALPKTIFLAFTIIMATHMLASGKREGVRAPPGPGVLSGIALLVASFSGMLGIGGASFFVPLLSAFSVATRMAIGTASALTVPIALAGAAAFAAHGLNVRGLPAHTLGFVHLEALAGVALGSMLIAPLGVAAAHRLPVSVLRKIFAVVLYAAAGKSLLATALAG